MSARCEYVGGPRDGDKVCIPVEVGVRVTLPDGTYEVVARRGELVAMWNRFDDFDPTEGEEWKT